MGELLYVEWDGGPADLRDAARQLLLTVYPAGSVADRVRYEAQVAARLLRAAGPPGARSVYVTGEQVRGWIEVEQRAR